MNLTLQNVLAIHGEFLEFVNTHRFRFVKDYSLSAANGVPIRHLRKHSIHGGTRELVFCPRDTGLSSKSWVREIVPEGLCDQSSLPFRVLL